MEVVYYTTSKKLTITSLLQVSILIVIMFFFFAEHIRKLLEETEIAAHKVFSGVKNFLRINN